ncbi:MAG: hypothetical protein JWN04_1984 [Myxococcaceae bacterium]|nr:hypothetical protein [Myxococcaceae bacterium]
MTADKELKQAELRVRGAKAHLAKATAEYARAATEARTLESDARRVDPDDTRLYARRSLALSGARDECTRCEVLIAQAQRDVDIAQAALREPQAAMWSREVSALEASSRAVAGATDGAIVALAGLFAARSKLRAATLTSSATQQRLRSLAADMIGPPPVQPAGEIVVLLRRAQALLWATEKVRPESIADPEHASALAKALREQLELPEYLGTVPYAPMAQVADMVSGSYGTGTIVAARDDA